MVKYRERIKTLPRRLMAGHVPLEDGIFVQIEARQPAYAPLVTRVPRIARVFRLKSHFEKRGL